MKRELDNDFLVNFVNFSLRNTFIDIGQMELSGEYKSQKIELMINSFYDDALEDMDELFKFAKTLLNGTFEEVKSEQILEICNILKNSSISIVSFNGPMDAHDYVLDEDLTIHTDFEEYDEEHLYIVRIANYDNSSVILNKIVSFDFEKDAEVIQEILENIKDNNIKKLYPKKDLSSLTIEEKYSYIRPFSEYILGLVISITNDLVSERISRDRDEISGKIIDKIFDEQDRKIAYELYEKGFFDYEKLDIFENIYLELEDENISNIYESNLVDLFKDIIDDGFLKSNDDLQYYIQVLKSWINYKLNNSKDLNFKKSSEEIQEIEQNIIMYQSRLKNSKSSLYYDFEFYSRLDEEYESVLASDFITFLMMYESNYIAENASKDSLTDASIRDFAEEVDFVASKDVKTPKLHHFPIMEFFYHFAKEKLLISEEFQDSIQKNSILVSMSNCEVTSALLYSLNDEKFLSGYLSPSKIDLQFKTIKDIFEIFDNGIDINNKIAGLDLNSAHWFVVLAKLGAFNLWGTDIKISEIGKIIRNYYYPDEKKSNVISFPKRD